MKKTNVNNKKNPFKVDRVRSMKLKHKAKSYQGNLKQLKLNLETQVNRANSELDTLATVIRSAPSVKVAEQISKPLSEQEKKEKVEKLVENYKKQEENEQNTLAKLENWSCSQ